MQSRQPQVATVDRVAIDRLGRNLLIIKADQWLLSLRLRDQWTREVSITPLENGWKMVCNFHVLSSPAGLCTRAVSDGGMVWLVTG